ncbi:MAG: hypothetical protein R3244_13630, partial [Thermoanaerobaculia bacterium]|nr:hypothetical protein [Thermoanaerobaculia bacterium]
RLRFEWILDRRRDLAFYIGSALAGWLYVAVIVYAIRYLESPLDDPLGTISLFGRSVALDLDLLVVVSWAILLDAPHVWATLGRTMFDPGEWQLRGRELRRSFLFFLVGPLAIALPYGLGAALGALGRPVSAGSLALGAIGFFVFFRLWAYYHVVRQHWGFFSLYKRKAGDFDRHRLDVWFFNVSMWAPLALFMTSSFYLDTPGMADLGLQRPLVAGVSVADVAYPLVWAAYLGVLLVYAGVQANDWRRGRELNGSKLLYMLPLIPLHLAAFSHPILAVFVVPLVTVGHNIQYHSIVYSYARSKYFRDDDPRYRWVRPLFRSVASYAAVGLVFTFVFYKGPWIGWLTEATGVALDEVVFDSLGMMAGVRDPASLGLGKQLFAAMILGFAMQHYYLDAKIWRVSRDEDVQRNLGV